MDRDRAKGGRKPPPKKQEAQEERPTEPTGLQRSPHRPSSREEAPAVHNESAGAAPIINYEQWMQCVRKQEQENLKELLRSRESGGAGCSPAASPSSPVPRQSPASPAPSCESSRADSGLSVGLWLDGAAPRSLELPRPQVEGDPRAHRSLESAQARPRQQPRLLPSSTSTDSGFSFSVSVPRLPDFSPSANNFFFRKRTEVFVEPPLPPPRESRAKPKPRQRLSFLPESSLYQVVVNRPRPKALRLDPVIFVPPERRRPTDTVRRRLEVREVRDYCSPRDLRPPPDEDLYESLDEEPASNSSESDSDSSSDYSARASDYRPLVEESSSCSDAESSDSPSPSRSDGRPRAGPRARRGPRLLVRPTVHRAPSTLKKKKKSPKRSQGIL